MQTQELRRFSTEVIEALRKQSSPDIFRACVLHNFAVFLVREKQMSIAEAAAFMLAMKFASLSEMDVVTEIFVKWMANDPQYAAIRSEIQAIRKLIGTTKDQDIHSNEHNPTRTEISRHSLTDLLLPAIVYIKQSIEFKKNSSTGQRPFYRSYLHRQEIAKTLSNTYGLPLQDAGVIAQYLVSEAYEEIDAVKFIVFYLVHQCDVDLAQDIAGSILRYAVAIGYEGK